MRTIGILVLIVLFTIIVLLTYRLYVMFRAERYHQFDTQLTSVIKSVSRVYIDTNPQLIPRIIYQTNESDEVPKDMYEAMRSLINMNPEYDYKYFNNKDARKFIQDNLDERVLQAYDNLLPGAFKADLWRYCVLYINGGVYIDSPMVAVEPLRSIIRSDTKLLVVKDGDPSDGIYNAFIGVVPNHPLMKKAIDRCVENIEDRNYTESCLKVTGPKMLGEIYAEMYDVNKYDIPFSLPNESGVLILQHQIPKKRIIYGDTVVIRTRYTNYDIDRRWYNTNPHYSIMWREGNVFA